MILRRLAALFLALSLAAPRAVAEPAGHADLRDLSIDELLAIRVTSPSRKEEPLAGVAAAVHVITSEDIRRSGARSIPDLLRAVPGLHVAQLNASTWAVGSRGFADAYSDKLLVLVDGRSVYTPLFSGVSWDELDVPLADIERIEVIRGPAASSWGANAVNGVINVIRKDSADMQGSRIRARAGTDEGVSIGGRHGFRIGTRTTAAFGMRRIGGEAYDDDGGGSAHDAWRMATATFRLDSQVSSRSTVMVDAGAHRGSADMLNLEFPVGEPSRWAPARRDLEGAHVQVRWTRETEPGRALMLQASASSTHRHHPDYADRLATFDFELDKRLPVGKRHDVTWGLGLRRSDDDVEGTWAKDFANGSHVFSMVSAFAQDDVTLGRDVRLTAGVRIQRDELGAVAVQPTLRVAWQATPRFLAWGAASRALRTSSRVDIDARLTAGATWDDETSMLRVLRVEGHDENPPERSTSIEAGFRWNRSEHLALDVSAFATEYDGLRTFEAETPRMETIGGVPALVVPARVDNMLSASTHGLEMGVSFSPVRRMRLRLAASALGVDFRHDAGSRDLYADWEGDRGNTPRRRAWLSARIDLPKRCELDAWIEHASGWTAPGLDDFTRMGLSFGWRPSDHLEVGVTIRDLVHGSTREHSGLTPFTHVEPMPRSGGVSLTWKF